MCTVAGASLANGIFICDHEQAGGAKAAYLHDQGMLTKMLINLLMAVFRSRGGHAHEFNS